MNTQARSVLAIRQELRNTQDNANSLYAELQEIRNAAGCAALVAALGTSTAARVVLGLHDSHKELPTLARERDEAIRQARRLAELLEARLRGDGDDSVPERLRGLSDGDIFEAVCDARQTLDRMPA